MENKNVGEDITGTVRRRMYCSPQYDEVHVSIRNEIYDNTRHRVMIKLSDIFNAMVQDIDPETYFREGGLYG